jgi:hypothetical protein
VPVVFITLEQLQEHGADTTAWRGPEHTEEQIPTAAPGHPDGDALYRRQAARAEAEKERRRAAEREARRLVYKRCEQKCTGQHWEETTASGGAWTAGDAGRVRQLSRRRHRLQGSCRRSRSFQAATPLEQQHDHGQEPCKLRSLFRRRG